MSRKYKFHNQDQLYFVSYAVVDWIDVFIRNEYKDILLTSLKYCQKHKGLEIYAWCIMTSHVHLIIGSKGEPMQDILQGHKSVTSRTLKKAIQENPTESRKEWVLWQMERAGKKNSNNQDWQFWQQHNQPIELSTYKIMDQKLDYIHNNPVVAGFVDRPEDYLYSSARDYCGEKGLLDVILIEPSGAITV